MLGNIKLYIMLAVGGILAVAFASGMGYIQILKSKIQWLNEERVLASSVYEASKTEKSNIVKQHKTEQIKKDLHINISKINLDQSFIKYACDENMLHPMFVLCVDDDCLSTCREGDYVRPSSSCQNEENQNSGRK